MRVIAKGQTDLAHRIDRKPFELVSKFCALQFGNHAGER